ncbi:hypothetical protein F4861DRAFT_180938 [Xylaria intraflava]|nr:hypothetical protein F4861DRAFT_180938 [Xylaria intraflava]
MALVAAVAVIVVSVNRMVMRLLTPQPARDLTIALEGIGIGIEIVIAIVNVTDTVVGIPYAVAVAHMMTDLADPLHDTTEIDVRVLTLSPSVIDATTATKTVPEMTTAGNVDSKAAMRTPERSDATRWPLIETTCCCLGGYVLSSRFSQLLLDFSLFSLPVVHQG